MSDKSNKVAASVTTRAAAEATRGRNSTQPLAIHILDVGHGDSIIIEFPGQTRYAIIDCNLHAESNKGFEHARPVDKKEPKALTFFRNRAVECGDLVVEFACLTHPHADHFRGFHRLLEGLEDLRVPVRQFWDSSASLKKARAFRREAIALASPCNLRDADEIEALYGWIHPIAIARQVSTKPCKVRYPGFLWTAT